MVRSLLPQVPRLRDQTILLSPLRRTLTWMNSWWPTLQMEPTQFKMSRSCFLLCLKAKVSTTASTVMQISHSKTMKCLRCRSNSPRLVNKPWSGRSKARSAESTNRRVRPSTSRVNSQLSLGKTNLSYSVRLTPLLPKWRINITQLWHLSKPKGMHSCRMQRSTWTKKWWHFVNR